MRACAGAGQRTTRRCQLSVPTIDSCSVRSADPDHVLVGNRNGGIARSERQNRRPAPDWSTKRLPGDRPPGRADNFGCTGATPNDWTARLRRLRLLPSGSRPGASPWTVESLFCASQPLVAPRRAALKGGRPRTDDAFDLIGHDGKDLRNCFSEIGAIDGAEPGNLLNEHIAEDGPIVFEPVSLVSNVFKQVELSDLDRGAAGAKRELEQV
jgi:hypothetical protein